MAVKLTSTGAIATLGKGRSKTVVLDVSFKELEVWAARNRIDEKKLWAKSYARACKGLKDKLRKVVVNAGGVEGVPKFRDFEAFTKELREKRGTSGKPMGGVLAGRKTIVSQKVGDTVYIGWPKRLAEWAVKFQDAEGGQSFSDPRTRYAWHRLGVRDIPRAYVHNPRRVLPEPFGAYARKKLDDWARHIFYKSLATQMAKKRTA